MKIKNINKPTSPMWNKIALACTAVSAFIGGYGYFLDNKVVMGIGGVLGILGVVIPIFSSNGGTTDTQP